MTGLPIAGHQPRLCLGVTSAYPTRLGDPELAVALKGLRDRPTLRDHFAGNCRRARGRTCGPQMDAEGHEPLARGENVPVSGPSSSSAKNRGTGGQSGGPRGDEFWGGKSDRHRGRSSVVMARLLPKKVDRSSARLGPWGGRKAQHQRCGAYVQGRLTPAGVGRGMFGGGRCTRSAGPAQCRGAHECWLLGPKAGVCRTDLILRRVKGGEIKNAD